ncbi:MAG: polysaccharide biosynthesis/export family protein [Deltaproteobacteria bacterium]
MRFFVNRFWIIAVLVLTAGSAFAAELEIVETPKRSADEQVDKNTGLRPSDMALLKEALGQDVVVKGEEAAAAKAEAGAQEPAVEAATPSPAAPEAGVAEEPSRYTLGQDDVIEIEVRRHPEFSDKFIVNAEGKIQYKFVGDIKVEGMTKTDVQDLITKILAKYVINPEVDVTILEYRSKVIYVIGEVGQPGKYYMRADKMSMREAIVQAGLPTLAAAMRRTTLIRPDKSGNPKQSTVDLYALLYEGKLNLDREMLPGDVVVVPATLFAKIFRVISPVASTVNTAKDAATPY